MIKQPPPRTQVALIAPPEEASKVFDPLTVVSPLLLIALGAALYLHGVYWGLPNTVSWSQDSVAGVRTLGAVEGWPDQWEGRYPPLHYFILRAAYEPVLQYWDRTGQRIVDPTTGEHRLIPPHDPKITKLIRIARGVSVVMAIAAGIGLWITTLAFTGDNAAALVAAAALMVGADFTYFAQLDNVDVPSICWLVWSLYFYARVFRFGSAWDCLFLGLFGSLAISTKDSVAGVYPGMAIVLLGFEIYRRRQRHENWPRAATKALLQWKWLIGLVAFVVPYLIINGVFANPQGYLNRMKYWLAPPAASHHAQQFRYDSHVDLFVATLQYAASGVGWPMLAAIVASVVFAVWRRRLLAVVTMVPALTHYVLVIESIDFVYARFLFPVLALLSILVGVGAASLTRLQQLPGVIRVGLAGAIGILSVSYSLAVCAEMVTDSRYDAELWFFATIDRASTVGAFAKPQYLPRLDSLYKTFSVPLTREAFDRSQPEYLILTHYDVEDADQEGKQCALDLLEGRLPYELLTTFQGQFLGTRSSWLSLAGWGAPVPGKISPTLYVFRRTDS